MELWIWGLLGILLAVAVLGVRLARGRRAWGEQIDAISQKSDALNSELKNNHNLMRFLGEFAQKFNGEMSFSEGVNFGLEALWHLPEIDSVAALLGEDELGPFRYVGMRGIDDPFAFLGKESPIPLWGILAHALVHRPAPGTLDCLSINNILDEGKPLPEEFPWLPAQGSLLVVPLRGSGKTIGSVILYSRRIAAFRDENRQRFLYVTVGYLSRALLEIRIHEQSVRLVRHLLSLQLLTRTMSSLNSIESILGVLREESTDMFGAVTVHLFLRSAPTVAGERPTFCLYADPHSNEQEEKFIRSPDLRRLLLWVTEAEQPLFVDPQMAIQSPEALYYRENGHGLLVPIFGSAETAGGVLLLLTPAAARPFDEDDLTVVRTIANSASAAIGLRRLGALTVPTLA